jgi:hypothetical protein
MNSAVSTSSAAGTHRPRVGMALIAALLLGVVVAGGAYAQRTGVLSMSDPGLTQSAAMRAQLTSAITGVGKATHHHKSSLLAWHAPKVPKVKKAAHRVITLPPRVVTVSAPAPAAAPAAPAPAAAAAPAPAPAPTPTTQGEDGQNGGGGDD